MHIHNRISFKCDKKENLQVHDEVERNSEIIQAQVDKNLLSSLTCGSQFQLLSSVGLARTACGNQGARKETSERRNLKGRKIVQHR